jgi:GxxExxY protein
MELDEITETIIAAAIEVHRSLGPGLLESAYQQCVRRELTLRNIPFRPELELPVHYKGVELECGYRIDLLLMESVVVWLWRLSRLHDLIRFTRHSYSLTCGSGGGKSDSLSTSMFH